MNRSQLNFFHQCLELDEVYFREMPWKSLPDVKVTLGEWLAYQFVFALEKDCKHYDTLQEFVKFRRMNHSRNKFYSDKMKELSTMV